MPLSASGVELSYRKFVTQTLPVLSSATPLESKKLAPAGATLSASVQSAGAELNGSNSVIPGGGETPKIASTFDVGLVTPHGPQPACRWALA